jgi:hypothetical protein
MGRTALWVALGVVWLGSATSSALIVLSLRPKPGANMVLTGLPCLALPTAAAAVAVWVAAGGGAELTRWERRAGWVAGGLALAVYGALAALG